MELCGGKVVEVKDDRGHLFSYCWTFARQGTSDCTVHLQVFKEPEKVNSMANSFRPKKQFAAAPNLRAVAVVSAPLLLAEAFNTGVKHGKHDRL